MGKDIWVGMMTSEDITVESDTMVGEPEVKLIANGAAAVVADGALAPVALART